MSLAAEREASRARQESALIDARAKSLLRALDRRRVPKSKARMAEVADDLWGGSDIELREAIVSRTMEMVTSQGEVPAPAAEDEKPRPTVVWTADLMRDFLRSRMRDDPTAPTDQLWDEMRSLGRITMSKRSWRNLYVYKIRHELGIKIPRGGLKSPKPPVSTEPPEAPPAAETPPAEPVVGVVSTPDDEKARVPASVASTEKGNATTFVWPEPEPVDVPSVTVTDLEPGQEYPIPPLPPPTRDAVLRNITVADGPAPDVNEIRLEVGAASLVARRELTGAWQVYFSAAVSGEVVDQLAEFMTRRIVAALGGPARG